MSLRRASSVVVITAAALFVDVACSKEAGSASGSHDTTQPHGSATAAPGSYEDWCGEHGVPESKCTRCDSSLVAAFKATGDWCAEHGLPESQCVQCDPSRKMTRPPKK